MKRRMIFLAAAVIILLASVSVSFFLGGEKDAPAPPDSAIDIADNADSTADPTENTLPAVTDDGIIPPAPEKEETQKPAAPKPESKPEQKDEQKPTQQDEPDDEPEVLPQIQSFTFRVVCHTLVGNEKLPEEKRDLVPDDGIIFEDTIEITDAGSAFEYMKSALTDSAIHFDFSGTSGSAYIKGINNLYEKDCGSLSGWMYSVNGVSASVGISSYIPQDGDVIEIAYTCNMGRDLK